MMALDIFPLLRTIKGMDLPSFRELDQRALAAGLSIAGIATRLGIGKSTYYRWRHGETEPTHSQFVAFHALVELSERVAEDAAE